MGGQLEVPGEGLHDVHLLEAERGGEGGVVEVLVIHDREARGFQDKAEHEANEVTHVAGGGVSVHNVEDELVDVLGDDVHRDRTPWPSRRE